MCSVLDHAQDLCEINFTAPGQMPNAWMQITWKRVVFLCIMNMCQGGECNTPENTSEYLPSANYVTLRHLEDAGVNSVHSQRDPVPSVHTHFNAFGSRPSLPMASNAVAWRDPQKEVSLY
jgi:hypothetical protein